MIWDFLLYLWLLEPWVISLIILAWVLGMLAVPLVNPEWLYRVSDLHIPGAQRVRGSAALPASEPAAEVVLLDDYRAAS